MLTIPPKNSGITKLCGLCAALLLVLAGCAPQAAPLAVTTPVNGQMTRATVVAIRPITAATPQNSGAAGETMVLAALKMPGGNAGWAGEEIVYLKPDGSPQSIAERGLSNQFTPGEHISVIQTANTVLIQQN